MNLGFLGPKMAVSWRISAFQKKGLETPIFIVFLGCALFGPSCQKREILDTHPKRKKIFTDNWKAHFWVFFIFSCFFLSFFCSFFVFFWFVVFLCFFLEGLRVMWGGPKGPPHLALNPPYLFCFVCFVFVFFCFFLFFFLFFFWRV